MSDKYIKLPREKIEFCGNTEEEKKANEMIFDLTLENNELRQINKKLKEEVKAVNRGLQKVRIKRQKWKDKYYNTKEKLKECRKYFDMYMDLHYKNIRFITWLENKNKLELQQHRIVEPVIKIQEVLDKIKGGNKDE